MNERLENLLLQLVLLFNRLVPKKERNIIFYSMPDYSDNCRAMYETLIKHGLEDKYNITWVARDVDSCRKQINNSRVNVVRHKSIKSLWAFARSKYIIRTHSLWGNKYVRHKQIMVIAWHGIDFKGPSAYERRVCPKTQFDFFCVTSKDQREKFNDIYHTDANKFCISGLPRNDYLFSPSTELLCILGLSTFDSIIMWMPTYRESKDNEVLNVGDIGLPIIKQTDLDIINDELRKLNICLVIKLHPFAEKNMYKFDYTNIKAIKNSDIPMKYNLYQLIGSVDAMISDYSSSWCDFLLLDKPIGFAYDDLNNYLRVREVPYQPIEEYMPGEKIKSVEELLAFCRSYKNDEYRDQRKRVADILFDYKDNKSAKRFLCEIGLI